MTADTDRRARVWGDAIRAGRDGKFGQAELARKLGVTAVTVWRWEHHQGVPSKDRQGQIVKLLDIDPPELADVS